MNEHSYENYRGCQICASAQLDARAGEGRELGAIYQPLAIIQWQDAAGQHRKLLCDSKRRAFSRSDDALQIAAAMVKR
ncbi:hypothetical protein WQE_47464 [Paraburkholderia hospita]|uniref:Uncharacterized protein n=1 Tax=Paraburkholderia hospita TaxID=169430 RepID=A0ABP2P8I6_9BURK|nr:hypothetical protein [Paraburkholderia hospita]EIM93848.1 hypothetical protein WQE_47464 [Paraburkholderia hospita]OUL80687.1 hypothetical protein CA602_27405 [Paraburkholderia hospita]